MFMVSPDPQGVIIVKKCLGTVIVFATVLLFALPCWATSSRVVSAAGYGAHDYALRADPYAEQVLYSAGLDVVYADLSGSSDGGLTRCFLHVDATESGDKIQVNLFDYNGKHVVTLCEIDPPGGAWSAWPQCVKLDPENEKVWFSYTLISNANDCFYTVDWDPSLDIYPVFEDDDEVEAKFRMDTNWEVEWSTDENPWNNGADSGRGGSPFFAGLNSSNWSDPHSIWVIGGDGNLQKVINIAGNSCGFAFDSKGNLWSGAYTFSANKLFMWTAADLDTAADSGGTIVLDVSGNPGAPDWGPTVALDLPYEGTTQLGAADAECDTDGNVYVSCNCGMTGGVDDHAKVVVVPNDGVFPWPVQGDMKTVVDNIFDQDQWDWFRTLSYDGVSNLDDGEAADPTLDPPTGNRLYVDMDFYAAGSDPDEIVGISVDADSDTDCIPDPLDNCWQTPNPDQADSDTDGFGDVCEGDLNGDGKVDSSDLPFFAQGFGSSGYSSNADLDGDGDVDGGDLARFAANLNP